MAEFTIEAFQNEYLPEGHNVMDAVITVTAAGTSTVAGLDSARAGAERSEVIIIDTSGRCTARSYAKHKRRRRRPSTACPTGCTSPSSPGTTRPASSSRSAPRRPSPRSSPVKKPSGPSRS